MKVRYIGGYSIKLMSSWMTKIVNNGDEVIIPKKIWEDELKGNANWEAVVKKEVITEKSDDLENIESILNEEEEE